MQLLARPAMYTGALLTALLLSACGGGGDPGPIAVGPAARPLIAAALTSSTASSLSWSVAFATPRIWHSLAANATGDVVVAGEAGGPLRVSSDAGATWTTGNTPTGTWISSAVSADGSRIVAVQYDGGMYMSTDRGASWTQVTSSPLVFNSAGVGFEAVTISQDGQRIAAVIQQGPIVLSSDGGATWTTGQLPDAPQARWWRWIDSSADGRVLVAVSHNTEIYRSDDAGASWHPVTVGIGSPATVVADHWYRVKVSADGQTVVVVGNSFGGAPGTGIYVSHDGGVTWTRGFSLVADYTFIAMTADGANIAVTLSDSGTTPGQVQLSTDGGASFQPVAMPGSDTDWRAIAMSSTGDRVFAATGAFNTQSTGLLYAGRTAGAAGPAPAPAPSCTTAPAWDSTVRYMPGDMVSRNGTIYTATALSSSVWNVGSPPEWTPDYWSVTPCGSTPAPAPAPSPAPAPATSCSAPNWDSTVRYMPGDRVLRNGALYVATPESASVWNVNSPPEWTPQYWAPGSC